MLPVLRFFFAKALIIFSIAGTVSLTPLLARDWSEVSKSKTLRVAVDGDTPGFNYYEGKTLTGFEVELVKAFAERLGLSVEWTVQPFNVLLVALRQDRFDLIATSHSITKEREKVADFTEPHYCTRAQIVSKVGGPKTLHELNGKTVAVPVGTVYYEFLSKNKNIKNLKTFPSETSGLQDLLSGRSDAWVSEEMIVYRATKDKPELQKGDTLFPQRNAMVVAKGNRELKEKINARLKQAMEDGTYSRLSEKYFGRDIRCR